MLEALTIRWVRAARRGAVAVLVVTVFATAAAGYYVSGHLGINTDTADMISPQLPWRQRYIDFQQQFPQFSDNLVVVIDGDTPDLASAAAARLSEALSSERGTFEQVEWTAGLAFFRRHALLFLDAPARAQLGAELVDAQPLLGRLDRDPSVASVAALLADGVRHDTLAPRETLDRFAGAIADAIDATLEGRFHRLSWSRFIAPAGATGDTRQVLVARPVLDFNQLFPAAAAIDRVRAAARELGLTPQRGVRVRVTGGVAMSQEELISVSTGAGRAAVLALAGVALVLALGLGSVRLVVVTLVTLVIGLLWTAAFAAAAVGHLNMISVAFAVLYIGLGVDYAVHYGLRYRELLDGGVGHGDALELAAADVGGALALCALTTGAGFFAFLPSRFAGVAELGLIAGVGMFVSLVATLTLLPALLTVLRPRGAVRGRPRRVGVALPGGEAIDAFVVRHPRAVCTAAAGVAIAAAVLAGGARFDDNPLNLRDPDGEAVSTYRELVADGDDWSLDVLASGAAQARQLAAQLEALPEVRRVVSIESFVPADQQAALAQVEELALLLGPDLDGRPGPPSDPAAARPALDDLAGALERPRGAPAAGAGLQRLAAALARLRGALDGADEARARALLASLQDAVTGTLPGVLARLGQILDADEVTLQSLPQALRRDWLAPDGRWRLRVDAAGDLNRREALVRYVDRVRDVAPGAVGTPVVHLESARVVVEAFVEAFALALACVALILLAALRRPREVLLVLAPLLLAALVAGAALVVLRVPFNFANVIALPLLLGVGVDSGIHMLVRARRRARDGGTALVGAPMAASSTGRGVVTSALTTTVSFGNLAFSHHPGTASMGLLLTVGMAATLVSALIVLPAMVALTDGARVPAGSP